MMPRGLKNPLLMGSDALRRFLGIVTDIENVDFWIRGARRNVIPIWRPGLVYKCRLRIAAVLSPSEDMKLCALYSYIIQMELLAWSPI